jgi:hypothetical protein
LAKSQWTKFFRRLQSDQGRHHRPKLPGGRSQRNSRI